MRMYKFCAIAAAVGLAVAGPAGAQTPATGTIRGQVTLEQSGAPIHGATVLVVGARRQSLTGDDGRFEILNVPAGQHDLLVQREHFSSTRRAVTVTAGEVATVDFSLKATQVNEEITVTTSATGATTTFESFSSVKSLDATELARSRGATLADALANQPGIAIRSFGAGSARPIIRGFDGDRVLIMQDGVRSGDLSSQSGDHGVGIDPAGLERLEVVRGPATLLFGSNAIGGVVNAITPQEAFRLTPFAGVMGGVSMDAGSANGQAGLNGTLQYGRGGWSMWAGGGSRRTGDYDTPLGTIANSQTQMGSARFGLGWMGTRAFWSLGGTAERQRFGVPFAGEFHHHGEEEDEDEDEELDVDIKSLRRNVRFDVGLRQLTGAFDGLRLITNVTRYTHEEIEIEDGFEEIGTEFRNRTTSVRLEAEQAQRGRLTGRLGLEWFGRDYRATGEEALAPDTRQSVLSAFAYEELALSRWRVQFGGRIEHTAYRPGERPAHDDDDEDEEHEPPAVRDRTFTGASASFGVRRDLGVTSAVVANLTTSARAPALEELYNFGLHVGNLAFEVGNPDLSLERTLGLDVSLRNRADHARTEFNVFAYRISNFVFLNFTGEEVDGLREADFLQGNSRFVGFEASGTFDITRSVHLLASVSGVRATLTDTGEALPRIPPFSGRLGLDVPWRGMSILPEVIFTARQSRVFREEAPTAGSAVVNIGASYFVVRGHATHTLAFKAFNLTNEAYRRHTSFIKDLAPEMGRGARVTYTVRFF
jgi:iron complex outermembrane recepter protein